MDIEKLIEAIKLYGIDTDTALYSLQAENKRLRDELEQVKREREADIKRLRKIDWCAGCKDFCGLNGCAGVGMANCTVENDHYQFGPKEG